MREWDLALLIFKFATNQLPFVIEQVKCWMWRKLQMKNEIKDDRKSLCAVHSTPVVCRLKDSHTQYTILGRYILLFAGSEPSSGKQTHTRTHSHTVTHTQRDTDTYTHAQLHQTNKDTWERLLETHPSHHKLT